MFWLTLGNIPLGIQFRCHRELKYPCNLEHISYPWTWANQMICRVLKSSFARYCIHSLFVESEFIGSWPTILWRRQIIFHTFRVQGEEIHHNVSGGVILSDHSLVLQGVTRATAGEFTCLAANAEGKGTSNPVYLKVMCEYIYSWMSEFIESCVTRVIQVMCERIFILLSQQPSTHPCYGTTDFDTGKDVPLVDLWTLCS